MKILEKNDLNKKFNWTGHKELWNWLYERPKRRKENWPGWERNHGKYESVYQESFACDYVLRNNPCYMVAGAIFGPNCFYCPFGDFFSTNGIPTCLGGLFHSYWEALEQYNDAFCKYLSNFAKYFGTPQYPTEDEVNRNIKTEFEKVRSLIYEIANYPLRQDINIQWI